MKNNLSKEEMEKLVWHLDCAMKSFYEAVHDSLIDFVNTIQCVIPKDEKEIKEDSKKNLRKFIEKKKFKKRKK